MLVPAAVFDDVPGLSFVFMTKYNLLITVRIMVQNKPWQSCSYFVHQPGFVLISWYKGLAVCRHCWRG